MKLLKAFFTVGLAAALLGASAKAADMPAKAPYYKAPSFATYNWTGWYGGVNVGLGASQTDLNVSGTTVSIDRGGAGFAGGVQGGFNWQLAPQWVVGLEGDIGFLGIKRSYEESDNTLVDGVKTDWYGTLRGRLGYTNGPSLFYATGGAAFVKVKNNVDDLNPPVSFASKSETATGWTVGGGIETLLGGNWSTKAEYLYIDAGAQDVFNPEDTLADSFTTHFDNRFHVYRYGLNYKFGGPVVAGGALPSHDWTGLYAGMNIGTGLSRDIVNFNIPPLAGTSQDIAGAGFSGGVQAGYDWQFSPNWVAGVEGDIDFLGIHRSVLAGGVNSYGMKTDWYGTLRGRLGYSTGPALLYVTGGAAFVNVKNNYDRVFAPQVFASKSETATGWTMGGGIEASLGQNWTAKTEYLYVDAGSQEVFNSHDNRTGIFDNRFHVFRFGLNYAFGH